jgi:hypothetical protein
LPQNDLVKSELFDTLGRRIKTLIDEQKSAGYHTFKFEAGNLASGVYLYRLSTGSLSKKSDHYVAGEAGDYVQTK